MQAIKTQYVLDLLIKLEFVEVVIGRCGMKQYTLTRKGWENGDFIENLVGSATTL